MKCDSHIHIYEHAAREHADVDAYRRVQARMGTERVVIVQPRVYGTDNSVTVDAIRQFGIDRARGIAVLHPDVADAELDALNAAGILGIRFTLYTSKNAAVGFEIVEPLAHRIAELGWHVQLHWTAEQVVAHRAMLERLPCAMVFDHRARLPLDQGAHHEAFDIVHALADAGRAWIELSGGPYLDSAAGLAGRYADGAPWVDAVPDRLAWGSDWPHVTENHAPDDVMLLDLLADWAPDDATRDKILVHNPAELYGFAR